MLDHDVGELRRKVAKLIVVRASGHAFDNQRQYPFWELTNSELFRLVQDGIGGVIFVGGTVQEIQHRCFSLQSLARNKLFLCADVEEGLGQRFQGGTFLSPPMSLGLIFKENPAKALNFAEKYGRFTGEQAKSCGLNWVLAPVCDINNNSNNPVINLRAWGEDPEIVKSLT